MEQITLDMIPNSHTPIAHISQYDSGRHIRFNLQNITLTGSETVTLNIRKTDGELVSKTIENHTSYVEYVSEKEDCDISGKANCEIVISKNNVVIGSKNFILNIEADPYDDAGVITETASGQIATFETNMVDVLQEVKCEINAKQDLHGEDKPYPAGGGVNLFGGVVEIGHRWEGDGTYISIGNKNAGTPNKMPCKPNTNYTFVMNNIIQTTFFYLSEFDISENHIQKSVAMRILTSEKTVTFTTGANTYFIAFSLYADTEFTSAELNKTGINYPATDTQYHPYENVCPIFGIDELNISRTGVNIFDEETELGQLNSDGTVSPSASRLTTKNYISVKGGTTYAVTLNTSLGKGRAVWYDANKQAIEYIADFPDTPILENRYALVTAPANACYFKWCFTTAYGTTYRHDTAILYPSTQTNYVAYNGQTYTIAFGQTVYGGVLDVTRGKLTVTYGKYLLDGNTATNKIGITPLSGLTQVSYVPFITEGKGTSIFLSNIFQDATRQGLYNIWNNRTAPNPVPRMFLGLPDTVTTVAQAIEWFANNPTEVVYELATPFDIDLTPVQIEALLGINNVWHDGNGNTEVKYLYNA